MRDLAASKESTLTPELIGSIASRYDFRRT